MSTLSGKKALVLGGSRGIGAAIVRRFVADGAEVVFTYAGSKDAADSLAREVGGGAIQADSADQDTVRRAVADQGSLDILVVNAGVFAMGDPGELDPDVIDRLIDINVRAPYHAAAEASKKMNDGGRIIFIGSVNGDRIPFPGATAYALSKSAIQGLTRGLARDLGVRNITVNNVQPGPIATDLNPEDSGFSDTLRGLMAIQRYGRPEEVAGMVAYLAGPEASLVTGAQHTIDGGFGA